MLAEAINGAAQGAAQAPGLLSNLEAFLIGLTSVLLAAVKLADMLGFKRGAARLEKAEGAVESLAHGLKTVEPNGGPVTDAVVAHAEANDVDHPSIPKPPAPPAA